MSIATPDMKIACANRHVQLQARADVLQQHLQVPTERGLQLRQSGTGTDATGPANTSTGPAKSTATTSPANTDAAGPTSSAADSAAWSTWHEVQPRRTPARELPLLGVLHLLYRQGVCVSACLPKDRLLSGQSRPSAATTTSTPGAW